MFCGDVPPRVPPRVPPPRVPPHVPPRRLLPPPLPVMVPINEAHLTWPFPWRLMLLEKTCDAQMFGRFDRKHHDP